MARGNWDGHRFTAGRGVGFGALLGAERAKVRRARDEAALEAARDKMMGPLVFFGSRDEPFGVDHIRVYWPDGQIDQHSTCRDCGRHIMRTSDQARRWATRCGCTDDHVQQMRSQRKRRARQAEHRRVHGGMSDYLIKKLEQEEEELLTYGYLDEDDYDV